MDPIDESKKARYHRLMTAWHIRTQKLLEHTPATPSTELLAKANLNHVIGAWLRLAKGAGTTLLGVAVSTIPENTVYKLYLRYKSNAGRRYTHKDAFFTVTVEMVNTPLPAGENHSTDQAYVDRLLERLVLGTYRQTLIRYLNLLAVTAVQDLVLYSDIWLYEVQVGTDGWTYRFRVYDEETHNSMRITLVFDRRQLQRYDDETYQDMKSLITRKNVIAGPWGEHKEV